MIKIASPPRVALAIDLPGQPTAPTARSGRPPRLSLTTDPVVQPERGVVRNPSGFTLVWEKWFQSIAQVAIPQFANEQLVPNLANGTSRQFRLPTAAPSPNSSLQLFDGIDRKSVV